MNRFELWILQCWRAVISLGGRMGKSREPLTQRTLAWLMFACGIVATLNLLLLDEEEGVLRAILCMLAAAIGIVRFRRKLQEDRNGNRP